jgi:hypothetical protein
LPPSSVLHIRSFGLQSAFNPQANKSESSIKLGNSCSVWLFR